MPHRIEPYWIPPHVRACSIAARTVLLDLKRNRYFGVGARETRALFTLALNWSEVNARETRGLEPMEPEAAARIAEALVQAGLLSREAPSDDIFAPGVVDLGSTLTSVGYELSGAAPIRAGHVVDFLLACTWAKRMLVSRSLYTAVREVSGRKAFAPEYFDEQQAIELVCIFRRLRAYTFGTRDRCLFHALALVNFLSRRDVFPTWVIGVRAEPWAAHSWVQQGSLILDGTPEQICEYTPILAV